MQLDMEHVEGSPEGDVVVGLNSLHGHVQLYQIKAEVTTPWYIPYDDLGGAVVRGSST